MQTKIFEKLFKVANYATLSKIERDKYEESLKYYNDLHNSLDTAFEEGKEEATKELMEIVEQERHQKEEERRQKEDERRQKEEERRQKEDERRQKEEERRQKEEAKRKLAIKMKKYGEPIEEIMKETGLSREEIENL